jgi:hypothetical protein
MNEKYKGEAADRGSTVHARNMMAFKRDARAGQRLCHVAAAHTVDACGLTDGGHSNVPDRRGDADDCVARRKDMFQGILAR